MIVDPHGFSLKLAVFGVTPPAEHVARRHGGRGRS
jgi:hypothetical protein